MALYLSIHYIIFFCENLSSVLPYNFVSIFHPVISSSSLSFIIKLVEKPAEAGGAPLGGRLKLCEADTRIRRAIIIKDSLLIEARLL